MTCIHRRNARRRRAFRASNARPSLLATAMVMASVLPVFPAYAAPVGGAVTAGAASINVGTSTTISQTTPRVAINWNSFSSAAGETIAFIQQNATDIALNRVIGASPSQLNGILNAKGQVFILNPNGVVFGNDSQVNVGGLLASTLGMENADFVAGRNILQGSTTARVVNQGRLTAAEGGYIALLGPKVVNDGRITATRGAALLAAGDKVTLQLEGSSLVGYSINLGSLDALVHNSASGVIIANGGRVMLEAGAADAVSKAVVNHEGVIEAQTLDINKGSIKLIGDANVGQVKVSGTLAAKSTASGYFAGSIETSAANVQIDDSAKVTTAERNDTPGTWQIKANNFEIAADSGARTASSIGATTLANTLGYTEIANSTVANSNVAISTATTGAGSGQGDIAVNGTVAWQGLGKLTLHARRNIVFNAPLAGASVLLLYGQGSDKGDGADFYFNNGAKISLNGDGATFDTQKGSKGDLKTYIIVRSVGTESTANRNTLQGVFSPTAITNYALGADIDALATKDWFGGQGFSPLASLFGTFEGLGHQISGLTINRPQTPSAGLFFVIAPNGAVRNLALDRASINGGNKVGGITGQNLGLISRSSVSGTVTASTNYAGGIAGENLGSINGSFSSADVRADDFAGGLVAANGVLGGSGANGSISDSFTTGTVAAKSEVGGLVGNNFGTIRNSYANAEVSAQRSVGGLVGAGFGNSVIENSYATGKVTGTDPNSTRGLVGSSTGSVTNSYWNTDTVGGTGQKTAGAGAGKTGLELRQAATFSNWDMATTGGTEKAWRIYEGNSMPLLRALLAPLVLGTKRSEYSAEVQQGPAVPSFNGRTGVAASGRGVGTYLPYSTSQQGYDISNGELVITPYALSLTATAIDKVYNGTTSASIQKFDVKPLANDIVTATSTTATFDDKNVGQGKTVNVTGFTLSGDDAGNYTAPSLLKTTASITTRTLKVDVTPKDKIYDATLLTGADFKDDRVQGDQFDVTVVANFANKNVGAGNTVGATVTLEKGDSGNYRAETKVVGNAKITQRPLDVTATASDKVYDSTTDASATLVAKPLDKDNVGVAYANAAFETKNVGQGKTVTVSGFTLSGMDAGNYQAPLQETAKAGITERVLDIRATGVDKVYDGQTNANVTLDANPLKGDVLNVGYATAAFDNKNVGTGKKVAVSGITLTGADAPNYRYQPQADTTAAVTPRPLDLIATAADKVYDGTTLAKATLQDNRIAGDALVTSAVASFDDKNAGAGKRVTVSGIAVAGADAGNYSYKPQVTTTSAGITPRAIDITATAADKYYDGATQTSAALADNRLAGDAVTASYQRADFADKNGGQQKTVIVSGIALGGPDAPNYKANASTTARASIRPIPLTITANPATKLADGVPYQGGNGVSYAGFLPGETAAVLDGRLRYGGDAQRAFRAGEYRITPGGLASVNYASTFVDGTLTIQPLPPDAGQIASYIEPSARAPRVLAGGKSGVTALSVADCGMRLPENLVVSGCQSASQPGGPAR